MKLKQLVVWFAFFILALPLTAQITITTQSPSNAANVILNTLLAPSGVMPGSIQNVSFTGVAGSLATFTGSSNIGFTEGIILSSDNANYIPNPATQQISGPNTGPGDPQLQSIANQPVQDAAVLQFDFQPLTDTLRFRYVFGSEEYPEYVCSQFNDVFGFFISGPNPGGPNYNNFNIARIPGTALPVSINSINPGVPGANSGGGTCNGPTESLAYSSLYTNNLNGATIIFDGFTHVLEAKIPVKICGTYHIKLAVGNCSDGVFDSGVFLEAHTFGGEYASLITASGGISLSSDSSLLCIGDTIILTGANAVSYQWNSNIGDSLQSFQVTQAGSYSLYVHSYDFSCFQISLPYQVITDSNCFVGINDIGKTDFIEITPNPFTDEVSISIQEVYSTESIVRVYSLTGEIIKAVVMQPFSKNISLSLKDLAKGMYLVSVVNPARSMFKRIIHE